MRLFNAFDAKEICSLHLLTIMLDLKDSILTAMLGFLGIL
jgi:hypothetical protein